MIQPGEKMESSSVSGGDYYIHPVSAVVRYTTHSTSVGGKKKSFKTLQDNVLKGRREKGVFVTVRKERESSGGSKKKKGHCHASSAKRKIPKAVRGERGGKSRTVGCAHKWADKKERQSRLHWSKGEFEKKGFWDD